jgi:hypothetical protein
VRGYEALYERVTRDEKPENSGVGFPLRP